MPRERPQHPMNPRASSRSQVVNSHDEFLPRSLVWSNRSGRRRVSAIASASSAGVAPTGVFIFP